MLCKNIKHYGSDGIERSISALFQHFFRFFFKLSNVSFLKRFWKSVEHRGFEGVETLDFKFQISNFKFQSLILFLKHGSEGSDVLSFEK